jgi:hypothetical protein
MARSDTRYSVYPAPKATEILGDTAPALNQAIECWAAVMMRAIADNARRFSRADSPGLFGAMGKELDEWGFLAEALKDVQIDPDFPNPGAILAAAVEDANRLEGLLQKWFFADHLEGKWERYDELYEREAVTVADRVRNLDYAHAWALVLAIRWFWQHTEEGIDIKKDAWWSLSFRRSWRPKTEKVKKGRKA